jgi:hypothetical protein
MDRDAIDLALHEIQQMIEVSIRVAERLLGADEDNGVLVSQMPRADHELLDFGLCDLAKRAKETRAILFGVERPVTIKPVLSIVRDPALKTKNRRFTPGGFFSCLKPGSVWCSAALISHFC